MHRANSAQALRNYVDRGVDLLLVNRVLDGDFDTPCGIELISRHTGTHTMLVSNYADAQAKAVEAGAIPGFGKSELTTSKARLALASALVTPKL